MQMIFQAVGYYCSPTPDGGWTSDPMVRRVAASFKARADAQAFCDRNNDAIQASELEVEEFTCVDDYGYPVTRTQYVELFPNML